MLILKCPELNVYRISCITTQMFTFVSNEETHMTTMTMVWGSLASVNLLEHTLNLYLKSVTKSWNETGCGMKWKNKTKVSKEN